LPHLATGRAAPHLPQHEEDLSRKHLKEAGSDAGKRKRYVSDYAVLLKASAPEKKAETTAEVPILVLDSDE
jgi:hypothetical protein